MDGAYACVDGLLDGLGGGLEWFLDDLGLILMDLDVVGRVFGWFLMVLQGFWMNVGWICDGRCMEFWLLYVFLIF